MNPCCLASKPLLLLQPVTAYYSAQAVNLHKDDQNPSTCSEAKKVAKLSAELMNL